MTRQVRPLFNLIEHLAATGATRAIFTTFALSPVLFDSHVVRRLLDGGCEELVLLTDQCGYEALLAERSAVSHAGCSYWVGRVDRRPYAFHPKVAILWSDEAAHLYVMSANLTHGGLWRNSEIVDYLTWSRTAGGDSTEILRAAAWCEHLPTKLGLSPEIQAATGRLLGDLRRILPNPGANDDAIRFIHNLDASLMAQVVAAATFDVRDVYMVAPFFSPDVEPVDQLAATFPRASITIAQPDVSGTINPQAVSKQLKKRVRIAICGVKGETARPWHAKFLLLRGLAGDLLLSGSPNMTAAALLKTAGTGNVETATLRLGGAGMASALFDDLSLTTVPWAAVKYEPIISDQEADPMQASIEWAEIRGTSLALTISGTNTGDPGAVTDVNLVIRGLTTALTSRQSAPPGKPSDVRFAVPPSLIEQLGTSVFVRLRARVSKGTAYEHLEALVMCPDEIHAPPLLRRFRAAFRSLQGADPSPDDLTEVLSFVRHCLSSFVVRDFSKASSTPKTPRPAPDGGDGPAVTLGGDERSDRLHDFLTSGSDANLLAALPALFRRVLEQAPDPEDAVERDDNSSRHRSDPIDSDGGEEEDGDVDTPTAPDWAQVYSDVREFLDWARDSFKESPTQRTFASEWRARVQMLEIALVLARFYFLRTKQQNTSDGARDEYINRIVGLLSLAVSGAGAAWNKPEGWFPQAQAFGREDLLPLPSAFAAQLFFNTHELIARSGVHPGAKAAAPALLAGIDSLFGADAESMKEVQDHLGAIVGAYGTAAGSVESVQAAISELRGITTPEQRALSKFTALLNLQEACRAVQALKQGGHTAASAELIEARSQRSTAETTCAHNCPDDYAEYTRRLTATGRWKHVVPVRSTGTDSCPSCNIGFPRALASRLRTLDQLTVCPNCRILIVPIPLAIVGVRK